ncbi:MAG: hypothetical protein IPN91_15885 [Holophagaceae bacterium]|uniref:Uncharacterized protein n=1 Tax=Candidatus Geothrix odensensis TaxID=2954440 RepID=A0A936F5D8_9BACT|nr:hypothetical protein [Candidatus Geothrix odensensis]
MRYSAGAGFFRTLMLPMAPGDTLFQRFANAFGLVLRQPLRTLRTYFVSDWAKEVHRPIPALHAHRGRPHQDAAGPGLRTGFCAGP